MHLIPTAMIIALATLLCLGCTQQRMEVPRYVSHVDRPEIGKIATAFVGDELVSKGYLVEEQVLVIPEMVDFAVYDVPAGEYRCTGQSQTHTFYEATGVVWGTFATPPQALAVTKSPASDGRRWLSVVVTPGIDPATPAPFEEVKRISEHGNSFQQTLLYNGRIGNQITIAYREFSNNMARQAFSNEVTYDLGRSKIIGYKGAKLEVLDADNQEITYRLIQNFPSR